jgi:hypothetical protein
MTEELRQKSFPIVHIVRKEHYHSTIRAKSNAAAFGVGDDNKHINTVDADGVALAAIQGLYEIVQEKDAQITALEESIGAKGAHTELLPFSTSVMWMLVGGLGVLVIPGLVLGYRRIRKDE